MPRTHRAYDEEFKRQAVELYLYSSNSLKQVARELGISDGASGSWRKDLFGANGGQQGVSHTLTDPEEMAPRDSPFEPGKLAQKGTVQVV